MKHTPGPWKWVKKRLESQHKSYRTGNDPVVMEIDPSSLSDADIALIAAAPEMLGALKALRARCNCSDLKCPDCDLANMVIAKAEGRLK